MLFFLDEDMDAVEGSRAIHDARLAEMAREDEASFLLVEYNPDRTPSLETDSPIPTSKLLDSNLSRAYSIARYPAVLVCDWHGNECSRQESGSPSPAQIKKDVERVPSHMEGWEKRLQKNLATAKAELEKQDLRGFFKALRRNFELNLVGIENQVEGIKLYRQVVDKAMGEIDRLLKERPSDAASKLKKMSKEFRDTEVLDDIADALDILEG